MEDTCSAKSGVVGAASNGESKESTTKDLKIVSWNINGMRTLNMQDILKQLNAAVVMVQETKLAKKQLDQSQVIPDGYSSYFSFSTNRVGYSGVATFCKEIWTPTKAEDGLCTRNPDMTDSVGCCPHISEEEEAHVKFANADGRTVITQHIVELPDGTIRPLALINVYCPRLRDDPEDATNNTDFKMAFHSIIHRRAKCLVDSGSFVALAGDINISHRWIDHCDGDPKTFVVSDFRKLLDQFLADDGFVDSFRMLHPTKESAFTCWNTKLNARENNYGTRIDYIFLDKELAAYLQKAEIHPDIMGSDHCPISVTFHSLRPIASSMIPSFATKYYSDFKGKQKNLKEFMLKCAKPLGNNVAKTCEMSTCKTEQISKKRPLAVDDSTKQSSSKRKQASLKSFFTQNSSQTLSNKKSDSQVNVEEEEQTDFPRDKNSQSSLESKSSNLFSLLNTTSSQAWKQLMKAPEVPLCRGHNEPCARRTVRKKGLNFGREFWSCPRGIGKSDDPNANCNFFQWVKLTPAKPDK